jgi:hypothetical protein
VVADARHRRGAARYDRCDDCGHAAEPDRRVRLTDLHVWRVGPDACAAIVEVEGAMSAADLRARLADIRQLAHLTVAVR